jgi:hypothetical protein
VHTPPKTGGWKSFTPPRTSQLLMHLTTRTTEELAADSRIGRALVDSTSIKLRVKLLNALKGERTRHAVVVVGSGPRAHGRGQHA